MPPSLRRLRLLPLLLGVLPATTQHLPEDTFARHRQALELGATGCVPLVASVRTKQATLLNGSHVALGALVGGGGLRCASVGPWRLAALAPVAEHGPAVAAPDAAVWEQHAMQGVWGISFAVSRVVGGPATWRPSVVLSKPVGNVSAVAYPSALPPWFVGGYWHDTVLPSATDVLADRVLGREISYGQIAPVLPRLTGQMGEQLEAVRHRGGPSFVSGPDSNKWWQVRQNGEIVVGDTQSKEGTAALALLHPAFQPHPLGFARPDRACEWPNHDGPGPTHGPACMHMQGLVGGWLPVINQGLRDTNGGSAVEQLILASGDSLFLGNRSGTVDDGWGHWSFYSTGGPENQTRLQQVTPGQFVTALLLVVEDAREFIDGTALSESRLQIPAEPVLADAARASLLLARATYTGLHPHYGIGSSYFAQENDGFPPTTLAMAKTLCAVGAPQAAADRLGYFLQNMVNNTTGAVIYYGTAISEYGQLLQAAATVATGLEGSTPGAGRAWIAQHGVALGRIARRIMTAQQNASTHRAASYGLLWGCPEADLCNTPDGHGLFFASGLWAWRGLVDLATAVGQLGLTTLGDVASAADMGTSGSSLLNNTLAAVAVSVDASGYLPPCLKCLQSVKSPFQNMTQDRISSYTNYRFWPEMLSSGGLPGSVAEGLGRYRQSHEGELLGMTRFEQWVDDWPEADVALWWLSLEPKSPVGSAERFTMATLAHLAHHSTRGTFTAFEQANYADSQADNCVPSQLVVPMLLTHMLVHTMQTPGVAAEERVSTLWLHRGVPRHWFSSSGGGFHVANVSVWAPGVISTAVQVHDDQSALCTLTVAHNLAPSISAATGSPLPLCNVILWLGDDSLTIRSAEVNGKAWTDLDKANSVVQNVPCVSPLADRLTTTIRVTGVARPPPPPPPPTFPPQPLVPPRCNCSESRECAFVTTAPRTRKVFAYLDDGGPASDRDNWESALDWNVTTHIIRNTHHPLLVSEDGGVVLNDASWPTTGKDSMLCAAHARGVRVLADVDPLGFDAHHSNPALEEASFLRNSSAVSRAAREISEWISAAGYDGAALDFEGLSQGSWALQFEHEAGDGLIALVRQIRAALRASNPTAEVAFAVATNNNPWFNQSYRMGEITTQIDYSIVMGYG